jgi:hypothetical protein
MRELSPERASEDFTGRVLDEFDSRRPSKLGGISPRWAVALATLAAVSLALGFWLHSYPTAESNPSETNAQLLLRQEYESLQSEVDKLRSLAAQPPPVLYLGGDSRVDLVLDLGQSGLDPTKLDIRFTATGNRRSDPDGPRIQ